MDKKIYLNDLKKDKYTLFKKSYIETIYLKTENYVSSLDYYFYEYDDYKKQLSNLKVLVFEGCSAIYGHILRRDFPIEKIILSDDAVNIRRFFYTLSKLRTISLPIQINSFSYSDVEYGGHTPLETLEIRGYNGDFYNIDVKGKTINVTSQSVKNPKINIELSNGKLKEHYILELKDTELEKNKICLIEHKIDEVKISSKDVENGVLDISKLQEKYKCDNLVFGEFVYGCEKLIIDKDKISEYYLKYDLCSLKEITFVDNNDMSLFPRSVTYKSNKGRLNIEKIWKDKNIYIIYYIYTDEYQKIKGTVIIKDDLSIIDLHNISKINLSDAIVKDVIIPKNITNLVLDTNTCNNKENVLSKLMNINKLVFTEEYMKNNNDNQGLETFISNSTDKLETRFRENITSITLTYAKNYTYNLKLNRYLYPNLKNIKMKYKEQIYNIDLDRKNDVHIYVQNNNLIIKYFYNDTTKINEYKFSIKDDKLICSKNNNILLKNIDINYLRKLNKLGIDKRVLYYTYYKNHNEESFENFRNQLNNINDLNKKDIKAMNDYGNILVKRDRMMNSWKKRKY